MGAYFLSTHFGDGVVVSESDDPSSLDQTPVDFTSVTFGHLFFSGMSGRLNCMHVPRKIS